MTQPRYLRTEGKESRYISVSRNSGAFKATRIHSAIVKGKQTSLPCEGQNLSKFEHNGREGPIVVYAKEAVYNYNKFGHYKVIMALKPVDSLRNQLFFAKESTKHNKEVLISNNSSHVPVKKRFGYVILIIIKFGELLLLRSYIEHSKGCFIRYPNTLKLKKR